MHRHESATPGQSTIDGVAAADCDGHGAGVDATQAVAGRSAWGSAGVSLDLSPAATSLLAVTSIRSDASHLPPSAAGPLLRSPLVLRI